MRKRGGKGKEIQGVLGKQPWKKSVEESYWKVGRRVENCGHMFHHSFPPSYFEKRRRKRRRKPRKKGKKEKDKKISLGLRCQTLLLSFLLRPAKRERRKAAAKIFGPLPPPHLHTHTWWRQGSWSNPRPNSGYSWWEMTRVPSPPQTDHSKLARGTCDGISPPNSIVRNWVGGGGGRHMAWVATKFGQGRRRRRRVHPEWRGVEGEI